MLGAHRIGGLYATGGDIAVEVTKSLGADGFEIDTEVLPLAVAGRLSGGPYSGLPFATKGGLIGGRDATGRLSGVRVAKPPARGEASVVTVACLEHLNHVLATGRKNP
ncbi:MAG TPA: nucleotide-binding domain containing protein [Amycolatopsis sp.]|uniref:nucleotide-binding domain containing protein n=1 Tax=Amycolatopsis sp. TaxID=37632 RepID=UPI002F4274C9